MTELFPWLMTEQEWKAKHGRKPKRRVDFAGHERPKVKHDRRNRKKKPAAKACDIEKILEKPEIPS